MNAVYQGALKLLSNNVGTPPDQPTRADLDAVLAQALREKFQEGFGYAYNDQKTAPPNKVGNVLYAATASFDSKDRNDAAVQEAVDTIVSSFDFPWGDSEKGLLQEIAGDIKLKIQRSFSLDQVALPYNFWDTMTHNREYYYADDSKNPINGQAVLIYCNGSATSQGSAVKRSFVYFIGVYYEMEKEEW